MDMTALGHILERVTWFSADPLLAAGRAFSDRVADMAVAALWQGALVAGTLAACFRLMPRISAAHRFAVWSAAFMALVGLSLFSLLPGASAAVMGTVSARIAESTARPWLSVDAGWSLAIAALWAAALLFRGGDLAIHSLRLRKLWKDAKPVQLDERLETMLAATAAGCGRGEVEVCTTATLQRPSVIGFFKPRILIPDWLPVRLTQGELEQIVLHEAEHLRRRDDWTNLVQKLCLVLFPLNPALLWIEHRLCREREMACDEGVIRITRAPRAYAACLTSLAERGLERRAEALSLGAWQRRPELAHRVHSILRNKHGLSPMGTRVLLSTLGCGLLWGSVALARCPQLVAFVPSRSTETARPQARNLSLASAVETMPVRDAAIERVKKASRSADSATSRLLKSESGLNRDAAPVAMNVTLRQPTTAESVEPRWKTASLKPDEHAPGPVMAKAARPEAKKHAGQDQQWVVLTTWEQVETSSDNSGLKADYDTDATATKGADTTGQPNQQPAGRITVTQLIFRVLPSNPGSNSGAKSATSLTSNQPGIATIRDGWLVIQL